MILFSFSSTLFKVVCIGNFKIFQFKRRLVLNCFSDPGGYFFCTFCAKIVLYLLQDFINECCCLSFFGDNLSLRELLAKP